jgi:hypothetical protein
LESLGAKRENLLHWWEYVWVDIVNILVTDRRQHYLFRDKVALQSEYPHYPARRDKVWNAITAKRNNVSKQEYLQRALNVASTE